MLDTRCTQIKRPPDDKSNAPGLFPDDPPPAFIGWVSEGRRAHYRRVAEGATYAEVWRLTLAFPLTAAVADRVVLPAGQLACGRGVKS